MHRKRSLLLSALLVICLLPVVAQNREQPLRENIPLDSIRLSDPFILADKSTSMYYMTGTGGLLWKSKDLKKWTGPFKVAKPDTTSWMGRNPMIWAAEIHHYHGTILLLRHLHQQGGKDRHRQRQCHRTPCLPCVGQRQTRRTVHAYGRPHLPARQQAHPRWNLLG
jgi:hypothetical protein